MASMSADATIIAMLSSIKSPPTAASLGQFHRFGVHGPAYEVIEPLRPLDGNDWLMRIVVLESGEKAEYEASRIVADPAA